MTGKFLGVARCSLGHVGVVTDFKPVTYPDGSEAMAYTGRHLWPLHLIFKRWSSRTPKWIYR